MSRPAVDWDPVIRCIQWINAHPEDFTAEFTRWARMYPDEFRKILELLHMQMDGETVNEKVRDN